MNCLTYLGMGWVSAGNCNRKITDKLQLRDLINYRYLLFHHILYYQLPIYQGETYQFYLVDLTQHLEIDAYSVCDLRHLDLDFSSYPAITRWKAIQKDLVMWKKPTCDECLIGETHE